MNPNDPNIVLLEVVAARLGSALRAQVVFVGGSIAGLLVTDPAMPAIRSTDDVDVICEIRVLSEYHELELALRALGFMADTHPDAPICRWRIQAGARSVVLDVMPTRPDILGFANSWYPLAAQTALQLTLPSGLDIRVVTAPAFLATKLEAFDGRGNGDYWSSHDLEDVITIVDGRASLLAECINSPPELRRWLANRIRSLLNAPAFMDALPAHLPGDAASQQRLPDVISTLQHIAALQAE